MSHPWDWASSNTVFRLPSDHHDCTFANYIFTPKVLDATVWFHKELHAGNAPHLILTGSPGNGKSHLSIAFYRHTVFHWGTQSCWWGDIPDFCNRVKRGMDEGTMEDLLLDATEADHFVGMDDVWGRQLTPWEMDNVVFRLLAAAIGNKVGLVWTTNYTKEQIDEALAPHERDRLYMNARVIHIRDRSHRQ